ncbi:fatty acyl-AMP ligase [Streptomyces blastmyceticus]|uniref:Fatty acyl-AMP ligase n=1 Tax=Streptomyces blastmyceticus TaxID=68180 RepID=A0ABN0WKE7_9ACTN
MRGNVVEIIAGHARDLPERTAVAVAGCDGRAPDDASLTFAELDRAARGRAVWLRQRCTTGARILLLYPTGLEFVKSLLGCMYAGMVPVPAPLPVGRRHHLAQATGIALDADAQVALTDSAHLGAVAAWADQQGLARMLCAATDVVAGGPPDSWVPPLISREPFALLQYTWGAASEPKGVMIGHDNLLHGLDALGRNLGLGPDSVFAGRLLKHSGPALVGLVLGPLVLGATAVLMPSVACTDDPYPWLRLMSRWRADVGAAPGFAYDLAARRVTAEQAAELDLSGWRHAFTAGTTVSAEGMAAFTERFAAAGFRPAAWRVGYCPPETSGSPVTSPPQAPPTVLHADAPALENDVLTPQAPDGTGPRLISRGTPLETDVRVVCPDTGRVLPEGRIGEIWLRGRSVGRGYWDKQDETVRTFRAVTEDGDGGYLRTGDIGGLFDGELYVTGRLNDVLVVQGRRLYAPHLEQRIATLDEGFSGLRGSVFTVGAADGEVVVVQEYGAGTAAPADLERLAATVRGALAASHGVHVGGIVFGRPGQVPRSFDGKPLRAFTRELFVADALDPLYEDLHSGLRRRYRPRPGTGAVHKTHQ